MDGADRRDQNVQDQRGRPNRRRRDSEKTHDRDVTGSAGVADGGIEKRDDADDHEKECEMGRVHIRLGFGMHPVGPTCKPSPLLLILLLLLLLILPRVDWEQEQE